MFYVEYIYVHPIIFKINSVTLIVFLLAMYNLDYNPIDE